MRIEAIEWDDANREHATRRASEDEINQAIDNRHRIRRNNAMGSGDYQVFGVTLGGRPLVVIVAYDVDVCAVRPITAWEGR